MRIATTDSRIVTGTTVPITDPTTTPTSDCTRDIWLTLESLPLLGVEIAVKVVVKASDDVDVVLSELVDTVVNLSVMGLVDLVVVVFPVEDDIK